MALQIDEVIPFYNDKVKITGWTERIQSHPYDNLNINGAHYRSLGLTRDFYVQKTTTQEAMENGCKKLARYRAIRRSIVNFTSFTEVDKIIAQVQNDKNDNVLKKYDKNVNAPKIPITTYKRDYNRNSKLCHHLCNNRDLPHPLFNRRPKNEFERVGGDAPDKFMDTHFFEISQNRKCINYLRQIRDSSHLF